MKNVKVFKVSITLIVVSLIISIATISKLRLDKPVFLKNYKEVDIIESEEGYSLGIPNIELKYIANREEERSVIGISFKEIPEFVFHASENNYQGFMTFNNENKNSENHGRYSVNTVYLSWGQINEINNLPKNVVLKEATITFDDNLTMDIDLGKIILSNNDYIETPLEGYRWSTSNCNSSSTAFRVNDDIEIYKVYSELFIDTEDLFDFHINKTDSINESNINYKKNDYLYFNSQFNNIDDIEKKLYSYDIKPIIYFKDKSGNDFEKRINNIEYNPIFNFKKIYNYLKIKEKI